MLSTTGLQLFKSFCKQNLAYGQYRVGSSYTRVALSEVATLPSGVIRASMSISNESVSSNMRVTRVELYNQNGDLFALENVSITLSPQSSILYWFDFQISEVNS